MFNVLCSVGSLNSGITRVEGVGGREVELGDFKSWVRTGIISLFSLIPV